MPNPAQNFHIEQIYADANSNSLELPSLPEVVLLIDQAIQDDSKGINDIANIIQLDPSLAARLIHIANSPLYRTAREFIDIKQVVQYLGINVTRNFVMGLVMHNTFNVKSAGLHRQIRQLWQHSCRVAAISRVLASLVPGIQADRVMLAGLLHDIGILPILVYADKYPELLENKSMLDEVLEQLRVPIGTQVIQEWKLDDELICVPAAAEDWYRNHEGEPDYADIVTIAHAHTYFGTPAAKALPALSDMPAFNKLSLSKMGPYASVELIEQAHAEINGTIRLLSG